MKKGDIYAATINGRSVEVVIDRVKGRLVFYHLVGFNAPLIRDVLYFPYKLKRAFVDYTSEFDAL